MTLVIHLGHHAIRSLCFALICSSLLTTNWSAADDSTNRPNKAVRILFVTQSFGYKHGSVTRNSDPYSPAEKAMIDLGGSSGLFRVDCTQDVARALTKESLENYDIVMFYTTGPRDKWPLDDATLEYFLGDWVKQKGHGFIGVHSAADTMADYRPYWEMLGGSFNGHPWTESEKVTVTVHEPNHPICKPWGEEFEIQEEIYQFKNWQPEKVRVLMSLNMDKTAIKKPYHVPIAWCKQYGDGKVFHMSLGHNEAVWADPRYQQSLLGGIKWILGLENGNSAPNPELDTKENEKAKAAVEAAQK
ncbi:MAG: ThuA domain-containing protein [Pirellulales bacterium]|nr:ThuA domain-containing protein [Pirellulales bacterium]